MNGKLERLAYFGGEKSVKKAIDTQWPKMFLFGQDKVKDLLNRGVLSCYNEGLSVILDLEDKFKKITGAKHSIYVNSGTAALLLAFYCANLQPGDEVIVPAYTYPATITPLFHFGVKIVLVDIEPDSYNISLEAIERNLTSRTKMIVVTHMRGFPVDLEPLSVLCKKKSIFLVEDASHAIGAKYQGIHVGNWGDCGCFSLSADKMISGGTAGLFITNDDEIYQKAHSAVNGPGRENGTDFDINNYQVYEYRGLVETGIGFNFKSSPINAAIIASQLDLLSQNIEARARNLQGLTEMLKKGHGIITPKERHGSTRGGWYGYRPFYNKEDFKGLRKDVFIKLMNAEGAEISGSGIKPFYEYPIVNSTKMQSVASFGRMNGDMFGFDVNLFKNVEMNHQRSLKFPVSNDTDALQIYGQYVQAIDKIYDTLDALPKEMFE